MFGKKKDVSFNGWKNWAHWNVNLWMTSTTIGTRALEIAFLSKRNDADRIQLLRDMCELPERTPDGAIYSDSAFIEIFGNFRKDLKFGNRPRELRNYEKSLVLDVERDKQGRAIPVDYRAFYR